MTPNTIPDAAQARALLESELLSAPTRATLLARLRPSTDPVPYFTPAETTRLRAAALRLVPHDPRQLDLLTRIGARLLRGEADGWRYDDTPPDGESYRALLAALPGDFEALDSDAQDAALGQLQRDHPHAFADLLSELVEGYSSHPLVQLSWGYVGFADGETGWNETLLNRLDPREQRALDLAGAARDGTAVDSAANGGAQ